MRFRLRTLLILLAVGPPLVAACFSDSFADILTLTLLIIISTFYPFAVVALFRLAAYALHRPQHCDSDT